MCIKCVKAMEQVFPEVPESEYGSFLMACTPFPFASGDDMIKILEELRSRMTTTDYKECYGIVSELWADSFSADGRPQV
jgi:hypothetical protein